MKLTKVNYASLNARQKENFNFQKVSAVLADYGFVTFRLSDDWQGADFVALHLSGDVLRVQLKSRLAFKKDYEGKGLHVAFAEGDRWYLYPHDELLAKILSETALIGASSSWKDKGSYNFPVLSAQLREFLTPYCLAGDTKPLPVSEDEEEPSGVPDGSGND